MRQILMGLFAFSFSVAALASPPCLDWGKELPIDNERVLELKSTTKNQFHARAHVEGQFNVAYKDTNGHEHFSILIGRNSNDTIEIIYNQEFGPFPDYVAPGATVEVCGDYITSFARAGRYPPSPDGAIIHWVHASNNTNRHPHGYVIIDGQLLGQDAENAGPKRGGKFGGQRNRR